MRSDQLKFGKYIIAQGMPVLFPLELMHSSIAVKGQTAGFFIICCHENCVEVICWGESTSLNLCSNSQADATIIRQFISNISSETAFFQHQEMVTVNK